MVKNYIHHIKNQPHQENEDVYIFVKKYDSCMPLANELICHITGWVNGRIAIAVTRSYYRVLCGA